MAQDWWMIPLDGAARRPGLSAYLKQLRGERTIYEVVEGAGLPANQYSKVQRYERRIPSKPDYDVIAALEPFYGQEPGSLVQMALIEARTVREEAPPYLPGPAVAIPADDLRLDAVEALYLLDDAKVGDATALLREMAKGPLSRAEAAPTDRKTGTNGGAG